MKIDASTVRVEIEERNDDALGASPSLFVTVYALPVLGLDRDHVYGWSVGPAGSPKAAKLAERLKAAVLAGAALQGEAEPAKDVNQRTYLRGGSPAVMGRRLNADLARLGF
jgi:hypothetical protein